MTPDPVDAALDLWFKQSGWDWSVAPDLRARMRRVLDAHDARAERDFKDACDAVVLAAIEAAKEGSDAIHDNDLEQGSRNRLPDH